MLVLVIFLYCVSLCGSSSILVVFTTPEKRNAALGEALVDTLLEAGHEVTYVTPFPKDTRAHNLEVVDIKFDLDTDFDQYLPNDNEPGNSSSLQMELLGVKLASRALQHPRMQDLIRNTTIHYDLVIAEWFYSGLLAPIASLFDCPYIWYSTTEASWKSISLMHSEITGLHETPPGLSMTERVYQMWTRLYFTARNYYHISSKELSAYEMSYRDAFEVRWRLLPNYEAVVYNGSMLFINSHPLLGHRTALPLNVKYIGGLHVNSVKEPLPRNLKKVMDDSTDGVIYVDLETHLIKTSVQEHITQELIEAFGHLRYTVIWKNDEILVNLPKNLYTMKKPPHHSILDHPNTVAFVNHGDMLSIIDATRYGVPIIGIPVLEEQFTAVKLAVERQCGIKVEVNSELSTKFLDAISEIATNSSYRSNARTAKSIIRQQLMSPRDELLYWVQLVSNTRGARHLRSKTLQVSTLERYNLDIVLFILMVVWFCTKVVKVCRVHLSSDDDEELEAKKDS